MEVKKKVKTRSTIDDALIAQNLQQYAQPKQQQDQEQQQSLNRINLSNMNNQYIKYQDKNFQYSNIQSIDKSNENKSAMQMLEQYNLQHQQMQQKDQFSYSSLNSVQEEQKNNNKSLKKSRWGPQSSMNSVQNSLIKNFAPQQQLQSIQRPQIQFTIQSQIPNIINPSSLASNLVLKANKEKINQIDSQTKILMSEINYDNGQIIRPELNDYIQRAFSKCLNNHERQLMQKFLKTIIKSSQVDGQQRDWKNFPLPLMPRERTNLNIAIDENQTQIKQKVPIDIKGMKLQNQNKIQQALAQIQQTELTEEDIKKRNERAFRFQQESKPVVRKEVQQPRTNEDDLDFENQCKKWKVVGTSQNLEKQYLRLTTLPDPTTVRPEKILKQSLSMLLKKWQNAQIEYPYIIEQFKSIRQDLTVQHIKNKFTVKVYESNARISLECHDMPQFNQCQSRLNDYYNEGINGSQHEFIAYRMIYLILNRSEWELQKFMNSLTQQDLDHQYVQVALKLKKYIMMGNIIQVFAIYKESFNLNQYLLDVYLLKLRVWAMQVFTKNYGEYLDVSYISDALAFNDVEECINFLKKNNCTITENRLKLRDCVDEFQNHDITKQRNYKAL